MSATIRTASWADLPAILAIYNDAVLHTTASYDLEPVSMAQRALWLASHEERGDPVIVAELGGSVVGFGAYGPFQAKLGYRFTVENSVYVATEWRGHGIGRQLLVPLIAHARAAGMHAMIAKIDAENPVSLHLHASCGFIEVGRFSQVGYKFDRWLDMVCMQLLLQAG
ncbi:MAG: N-acetyltransferase [Oscillochloris sp.]|nr:N-acetyltransferase [Oscillochloris sp.]